MTPRSQPEHCPNSISSQPLLSAGQFRSLEICNDIAFDLDNVDLQKIGRAFPFLNSLIFAERTLSTKPKITLTGLI
ncbi:hypothetical protein H2248_003614 [Termitomyces sp. 'cryptogamus']|nr:hypothetical protein H2248_003614 [Termitomyces sp. 'cryptogamus']